LIMLALSRKNRCSLCRSERSVRKCPRKNKDIGWTCCNELRTDMKCPAVCVYAPKQNIEDGSPFPAFRTDSNSEYQNLIKQYLDYWIHRPQTSLDGLSPAKAAAGNPDQVVQWLASYQYPAQFPMEQLLIKLGLPASRREPIPDPESVALAFIDAVIALEWDRAIDYTVNSAAGKDLRQRYTELISAIPPMRRFKSCKVIHAGIADDGITALVFLEINNRLDWSIILSNINGCWQVRQNLAGSPHLFYAQNGIHQRLAEALSNGRDSAAWEILQVNMPLYPDSADLRYYLGLYWQLVQQNDKAKVEYFNSVALDNGFYTSAFMLGSLYLHENELNESLHWFEHLQAFSPDDLNVQNNIAACHAGLGDLPRARAFWGAILAKDPGYELARKNMERYAGK